MGARSWDLETRLIDRAYSAPRPVCASWQRDGERPQVALFADAADRILDWLRGDEILVGTFLAFDSCVIAEHLEGALPLVFEKYARGQIQCIDVNQKIIDIASRGDAKGEYSMEALAVRYGHKVPDKTGPWRTSFESLEEIPVENWPAGATEYVLDDASIPLAVWKEQIEYGEAWLKKTGKPLLHLAGVEAYKQFVLQLISCRGLRASHERTQLLAEALETTLAEYRDQLAAAGLVRADGSKDTKKAKAYAVSVLGEDGVTLTKGGDVSLKKDVCFEAGDALLEAYSYFTQATGLRSRVQDMLQGVDLPLQPRFNSLLNTSRTSASKPRPPQVGVQVHNFPRMVSFRRDAKGKPIAFPIGAREALEPRPGMVFVLADYGSAELHSLAQTNLDWFGESVMADQLNAGRDLHLWFGSVIKGMDFGEATRLFEAGDKDMKGARQQAKPCNFGFPGGMGAEKFAIYAYATYKVRFLEEEAAHLKQVWLRAFPEMALYFKAVDRLLAGKNHAWFAHTRSGRWRGRVPYCASCNSQFQELTATAAADALCEVQRQAYTVKSSALYECPVVMFTHDEIVLESPLDRAHECAMTLKAVMETRFNEWHPGCPTDATPLVTSIYSKDAKAVWQDGSLVPWTLEQAA